MSKVIVYSNSVGGVAVCFPSAELSIEEVKEKDTPEGSVILDLSDLPCEYDVFFDAWELHDGVVSVAFEKAKSIAHDIRRSSRAEEMEPFDAVIAKQIPGQTESAEAARQAIREKYVAIQTTIDAATSIEQLKADVAEMKAAK